MNIFNRLDLNIFSNAKSLSEMHIMNIEQVDYTILRGFNLNYLEIDPDDSVFQIVCGIGTLKNLRVHGSKMTNISGVEKLQNLRNLDLLAENVKDIRPLTSLKLDSLEIDVHNDCDISVLKNITTLRWVKVPEWNDDLYEKIKAALPNIEVTKRN